MSNNKQTAVEWLISELRESKDFHRVINELNQRSSAVRHILNEAQQKEREQIIEAYRKGVEEDVYVNPLKTGTQYFNETFKTKNHD